MNKQIIVIHSRSPGQQCSVSQGLEHGTGVKEVLETFHQSSHYGSMDFTHWLLSNELISIEMSRRRHYWSVLAGYVAAGAT